MTTAVNKDASLEMARRVLGDDNATASRRAWARDVIAWLERGDEAAMRRLGVQA